MPICKACGDFVSYDNAVRGMVANEIVYYHRYDAPQIQAAAVVEQPKKKEKPAAKKVVIPDLIATSTAKGTKGWKGEVRRKYGPEVLAAAIGRPRKRGINKRWQMALAAAIALH